MEFRDLEEIFRVEHKTDGDKLVNGLQVIRNKKTEQTIVSIRIGGLPFEIVISQEETIKLKEQLNKHY